MTEAEMMADLAAADAAGDTQLAQAIASRIKAARGPGGRTVASHSGPAYEPPRTDKKESGARGALQGASFGWGDEAAGAVAAVAPFLDREAAGGGKTLGERYRNARDFYRNRNATAQESNPGTYLTGQVVGGVAPTLAGGAAVTGTKALLSAAGQGAAAGAGYSEDEGLGLARDTALGGALGTAGYGAGAVLGKGASWALRKGRGLVRTGVARNAEQAAEAATAPVRSLEAAARERAANSYRQMERVNLALADKALPAEERAALEAFKQTPEYAALLAANARGALTAAPEAAAERAAAQQIAAEARAALPAEIQRQTAEGLKTQVKADAKSFAKGWLEPVAWAVGADQAGKAMGLDETDRLKLAGVAGLIGGRTRAGKALWTRLNRPAHQVAIGKALERAGTPTPQGQALLRALQRAGVAGAIPATVEED